jgi:hypothetical protein
MGQNDRQPDPSRQRVYYSTNPQIGYRPWALGNPHYAIPLEVAIRVAEAVDDACRVFCDPTAPFAGDPEAPPFPDETVREVIFALQHQLDQEGERRVGHLCTRHGRAHEDWYHLDQLPLPRQRALVERVWRIKKDAGITVPTFPVNRPANEPSVASTAGSDPTAASNPAGGPPRGQDPSWADDWWYG